MWQSSIGGQPMTIGYVIQHASWSAFGKLGEAMEKDAVGRSIPSTRRPWSN